MIFNKDGINRRLIQRGLKFAPEALWTFAGQAGTIACGMAGVKILTHVVEPSEYGVLALANTITMIIVANFFGPLNQSFIRFWAISKERGHLDDFYAVSHYFAKYASLAAFLGIIVFCSILCFMKFYHWAVIIAISLIIGIVTGVNQLRSSILTAMRKRREVAILRVSDAFLRPLIAASLILLIISKASIALFGYFLTACFSFLLAGHFLSQVKPKASSYLKSKATELLFHGLGREMLIYCYPFFIWGFFGWFHTACDKWALQAFCGLEVVGTFAVVSFLAVYPITFISDFFCTLFTPIAFQRAGDMRQKHLVNSANRILLLMTGTYIFAAAAVIFLFALFHHPITLLISNEQFAGLSKLLPGLTLAWSLFHLGQVLTQFGLLMNKPKVYIAPKILASIITGLTTFYLAAKTGPPGVVTGLIVGGAIYGLWCGVICVNLITQKQEG